MEDRVLAITGAFGETGRIMLLPGCDLTIAQGARSALESVGRQFGRLDAVLNVAGGFRWEAFEGGALDTWPSLYRLNVLTATNACRAALPLLRQSAAGRIVNVGSAAALSAGAGMGAYAAAKAGVHSLTQALAVELRAGGLTVNAVLPSINDTPTNRTDMPDADPRAWVAPDELAEVMLFLVPHVGCGHRSLESL